MDRAAKSTPLCWPRWQTQKGVRKTAPTNLDRPAGEDGPVPRPKSNKKYTRKTEAWDAKTPRKAVRQQGRQLLPRGRAGQGTTGLPGKEGTHVKLWKGPLEKKNYLTLVRADRKKGPVTTAESWRGGSWVGWRTRQEGQALEKKGTPYHVKMRNQSIGQIEKDQTQGRQPRESQAPRTNVKVSKGSHGRTPQAQNKLCMERDESGKEIGGKGRGHSTWPN